MMIRSLPATSHPAPLELTVFAAGERDGDVGAHVRRCSACAAEVAELRDAMAALAGSDHAGTSRSDCLDAGAIARIAGGEAVDPEREHLLAHLATCGRCRAAAAAVAGALADDAVARELRSLEAAQPRRWVVWGSAVAAAALLLVLVPPRAVEDGPAVHRAPSSATLRAPELLAPVGDVAGELVLRWRTVPGADQYRVTLYHQDGSVLREAVVADTVAQLPQGIRLEPGTYYWTAAARTGWDRWTVADLASFTLAEPER